MANPIKRFDKWLGEREIENTKLGIFTDETNILKAKLASGSDEKKIREEISFRDYILNSEEPDKVLGQLNSAKARWPMTVRYIDLAQKLGWDIDEFSPPTGSRDFGVKLLKARMKMGGSLQQMAKAIGSNTPGVIEIEKGRIHPSEEVLEKMLKFLGVTIDQL